MDAAAQQAIVQAMLKYVPCPNFAAPLRKPDFTGWGISKASAQFLAQDPNAFLIGAVFARMITAEKAWESPRALSLRLGHFDVNKIARLPAEKLAGFIKRNGTEPALHRFPNIIGKCVVSACRRLVKSYKSNAENVWKHDPRAVGVLQRLEEFDGVGQKIANMTVRLLMTYYGVKLTGWDQVDVAVDRHVARVFLRTGLVQGRTGTTDYAVGEIKQDVIAQARALFPKYPGALDEPAFLIGKFWCTADHADCRDGEEPCPLLAVCPRNRRSWQIA